MKIRTRYAPSPTGYFHIGGARTALYNFLYAKHFGGDFIVRIEDTDIERNVEGGVESQLNNISWMNITPDESPINPGKYGPYKQTEKIDKYKKLAEKLVQDKKAYYCFCSKEELDDDRKAAEENHVTPKYSRRCYKLSEEEINKKINSNIDKVIRLKMDDSFDYKWDDIVRGEISIPSSALTDPVILKSNGIAMYNFAVVIDDYDMEITQVLRGEEHISNTPYQIAIKNALNFNDREIKYGHLSIIINEDGKKLSKRDLNLKQFISDYKEMGFPSIAVVNFLALLGWSSKDNKEVMDLNQLIEKFDVKLLKKAPAQFDILKLKWLSNQHVKLMDETTYINFFKPFVKSQNNIFLKNEKEVMLLLKPQISCGEEIDGLIENNFNLSNIINDEVLEEIKANIEIYNLMINHINNITDIKKWTEEEIKNSINFIKEETKLTGKNLFMSIRIITTKQMHGPELAKVIYLFGKDNIIKNIEIIKDIIGKYND